MPPLVAALIAQCEETVSFLCRRSLAPYDEFDNMAFRLGEAADALAGSIPMPSEPTK